MHRITDVGRHQTGRNVQPLVAQLGDPARKEPQRQGVCRSHLHDLALPAFQVMQMAHDFAQLLDHGAGRDQK